MSKEINNEILKDAQYRKGLSIAFFNATNNAIEMVKSFGTMESGERLREQIIIWRDWMLEEHKNYYSTVIANVGANYKLEDTLAKLNATTTKGELLKVWLSISEDERRDGDVQKLKDELKKKYEELQLD